MANDTVADLDVLISNTYAQLVAATALKSALITELTGLSSFQSDIGSVSQSGKEGSESYTRQSLMEKIKEATEVERLLMDQYEALVVMKRKMDAYEFHQVAIVNTNYVNSNYPY